MDQLNKCSNVIYAFLMGSRLWGNYRPDSDYDYLIVIKDDTKKPSFNFDATIHTETEFLKKVKNNEFIETVACLVPNQNILISKKPIPKPILKPSLILEHLMYRLKRDSAYIKKNTSKGKRERAEKTRKHSYVTLMIGHQMYHDKSITNFNVAAGYSEDEYRKLVCELHLLYD